MVLLTATLAASSEHGGGGRSNNGGRGGRGCGRDSGGGQGGRGQGSKHYAHCGVCGHKIDYCWDLNGKPTANQVSPTNQSNQQASSVSSGHDLIVLKKEDINQFFSQHQNQPSSSSTTILAKTDDASSSNSWIIDSGATDHMTGNAHIFSFWNQLSQNIVRLADGCSQHFLGERTSLMFPSSILFVPKFPINLVFVSKPSKLLRLFCYIFCSLLSLSKT